MIYDIRYDEPTLTSFRTGSGGREEGGEGVGSGGDRAAGLLVRFLVDLEYKKISEINRI